MVASVDVVIMRPIPDLDPRFAVAYFSSSRHLALAELLARGTTMQRLSRSQVGAMPLPLPPIDTQRRIVAEINGLLARQKALVGALDAHLALLFQSRQATITAALAGLQVSGAPA
jgi:type I restriction enzyme S subunit